jgi:yeast amino acid transporter
MDSRGSVPYSLPQHLLLRARNLLVLPPQKQYSPLTLISPQENPRKTIPRATKQVTWRIIIFYIVSLTIIGCLVPYTDPRLLHKAYSTDIKASPFVIAVQNAGIKVVPSIMNAVILISVLSVGNSSTYGATRTLQAMAEKGLAPKIFMYIDKRGRPLPTLILILALGLISYIGTIPGQGPVVFDWLLSLSGLSTFFTWSFQVLSQLTVGAQSVSLTSDFVKQ